MILTEPRPTMGLWPTKGDEDADVAQTPSKVRDVAAGKSFIFIPIVARAAVMGTLVSAASTLVSMSAKRRDESRRSRQSLRHVGTLRSAAR